jgi:hypothetical protein
MGMGEKIEVQGAQPFGRTRHATRGCLQVSASSVVWMDMNKYLTFTIQIFGDFWGI